MHPQDQRKDTLAADINLTDRQRLQFRRNNYAFFEYQPLDGTPTRTPKFFNRPNQTNSLDYVWTISPKIVNEAMATVSLDDVYIPGGYGALLRSHQGRHQLSVHVPERQADPDSHSDRQHHRFERFERWSLSVSFFGSDLHGVRQLDLDQGQSHDQVRLLLRAFGENDNDEINVSACPTCTNNQNGQFTFHRLASGFPSTGNAIANTALGLFDSYSELGQRAYTVFRGSSYEPYAQDSWKVNAETDHQLRHTLHDHRSLQGAMGAI